MYSLVIYIAAFVLSFYDLVRKLKFSCNLNGFLFKCIQEMLTKYIRRLHI